MENIMNAWDNIVGQTSIRSSDGVAQIFQSDKPEQEFGEPAPKNYYDYINGQTGFLRDATFYKSLLGYIETLDQGEFDIFIAAGSTGAEAYSAAILKDQMGITKNIRFHTSDISETYLRAAQSATYPAAWIDHHGTDFSVYFNYYSKSGAYVVKDEIRQSVIVRNAEDMRFVDTSKQFDVVIGMNFLMHVITSKAHLYGHDKFDQMIIEEAERTKMSRREFLKAYDRLHLDDIDPILENMCKLSKHLVCVNRLEDTPYWHCARKVDRDIFADNGFSKTVDSDWNIKPSRDLEDNSTAGRYSRKRDYAQVLVRG